MKNIYSAKIFSMELKKQFTFSGIFKKLHAEDLQPVEISNTNIYCYIDGTVSIEIDFKISQLINYKRFIESTPIYLNQSAITNQPEIFSLQQFDDFTEEILQFDQIEEEVFQQTYEFQQPYEGDYEIQGKTVEGWKIKAIVRGNEARIILEDLYIDYQKC